MIHAVTFMAKGDIPMEKILPMMRFFIFQKPGHYRNDYYVTL